MITQLLKALASLVAQAALDAVVRKINEPPTKGPYVPPPTPRKQR